MNVAIYILITLAVIAFVMTLLNPWFEDRTLTVITAICASVAWLIGLLMVMGVIH